MRRRPLLISLLAAGCLLAAGAIWLALAMGPLGALSLPPPLSAAVHTEASPCVILLITDARSADRAAIAKALQAYVAANGYKPDTAGNHPTLGAYDSTTYDGPGTLNLLASTDSKHVTIQIFRDDQDHANYTQQLAAAQTAFKAAGLTKLDCN